jgi:hypothetical protein
MDTYRGFEADTTSAPYVDDEPVMEAPPEIGIDERRMHVRAYNYWLSLLDGRAYPAIGDLDPATLDDFGPHSVLVDFTDGPGDPAVPFIGRALRRACNLEGIVRRISDVPPRSLLSRLTDHYMQIIANRAPIGFEAEFTSQTGQTNMYRGILMPLSSDGNSIDFIYGVINWKEIADSGIAESLEREVSRSAAAAPVPEASSIWADGPNSEPLVARSGHSDEGLLELGPEDHAEEQPAFDLAPDENAGLADRLWAARECAEAVKSSEARSRGALYRALGQAYDFALAAEDVPEDYAEILEDAGIKAQARAPMTPVAKLVFGAGYDKTRLTEFAAALSFARRQALPSGGMPAFLDGFEGGLKGVVQAERRERRPAAKRVEAGDPLAALRRADPIAYLDLPQGDEEFVLLIARRQSGSRAAVVAPVAVDKALLERAIRKAVV